MIAKRCFDLFFTIPGVIILSPILGVIALWIKLDSKGPIFFRQERVGLHGKIFRIFKFRTMIVDAEIYGKQITIGNDKRVTNSGYFLRKYKFDELPQLFNICLGEMSLVGPRPEVPRYIEEYTEEEKAVVLSVLPGITDYASIEYKNENEVLGKATDPEKAYIKEILPIKIQYYRRYVDEQSLMKDFMLIVKTFLAIFR
jgi:lipopolysaccharide/colanic/teichoic acid biosynthesis glycosyltransferase